MRIKAFVLERDVIERILGYRLVQNRGADRAACDPACPFPASG